MPLHETFEPKLQGFLKCLWLIAASLQQYINSILRFHSVTLSAWRMVILTWSLCNIPVHGPTDQTASHRYPADQIW